MRSFNKFNTLLSLITALVLACGGSSSPGEDTVNSTDEGAALEDVLSSSDSGSSDEDATSELNDDGQAPTDTAKPTGDGESTEPGLDVEEVPSNPCQPTCELILTAMSGGDTPPPPNLMGQMMCVFQGLDEAGVKPETACPGEPTSIEECLMCLEMGGATDEVCHSLNDDCAGSGASDAACSMSESCWLFGQAQIKALQYALPYRVSGK